MRYDFDMLGTSVHQASMEAGERWMLNDVAGQTVYAWDSRAHRLRTTYDALRRPLDIFCKKARSRAADGPHGLWRKQAQPGSLEPARQGFQHFDQAGVVTSELRLQRQPARRPRQLPGSTKPHSIGRPRRHWNTVYTSRTTYDALNRPTSAPRRTAVFIVHSSMRPTCSKKWMCICAAPRLRHHL